MALLETLNFYEYLLLDAGFKINADNQLQMMRFAPNKTKDGWDVTEIPVTINSKGKSLPVVLPTKDEQKKAAGSNILYHPLSEQIDRGISNTLEITRKQMEYITQLRFVELLMVCGHVLTTSSIQEKLSPTQAELLSQCPDFNQASFKIMSDLLVRRQLSDPLKRPITLCVKTAKLFKGEPCKRICATVSPLYHACKSQQKEIWGLKNIPLKHSAAIAKLIEFILPGFGDEEFSHGSDSSIAPQFDSLVRVFGKLSHRFDKLDKLYGDYVENGHPHKLSYEWEKSINQLGTLRNPIEPQEGNLGAKISTKEALHRPEHEIKEMSMKTEDTPPWNKDVPAQAAPAPAAHNHAPTPAPSDTTMVFDPSKVNVRPAQPQQSYHQPAPQQYHQQQSYQPQYHQPPQQQPTPTPREENGRMVYQPPQQYHQGGGYPMNRRRGRE